jgi:hypothetical protein
MQWSVAENGWQKDDLKQQQQRAQDAVPQEVLQQ